MFDHMKQKLLICLEENNSDQVKQLLYLCLRENKLHINDRELLFSLFNIMNMYNNADDIDITRRNLIFRKIIS